MKKVLSVFLAMLLVCGCLAPLAASAAKVSCPVVYVGGQEQYIYSDKNDAESETYITGSLPEEALDEINPTLRTALAKALAGSWEDYLEGFYNAAIPYYNEIILDNAGLPINDTGYDCLREENIVNKAVNGRFGLYDYKFIYDWRLDPCANAVDLNAYIDDILEVTGARKVDIVAVGIGCSTVLAYLQAYGSGKINELVLDNAALDGSDVYGAYFSNKIEQDPEALAVFVAEVRRNVALLQMIKRNVDPENWDSYASVKATRKVYGKLYENVFPRIARTVYATMPGYWSLIGDKYYEDAIDYIFADYEVANENALLLEKINNYHYNVQQKTSELLAAAVRNGVNVYNIVNYGFIMVPVSKDSITTSDVYVSVKSATLGATVAKYGEKLDEDYLAAAAEEEEDAYISPDGEIDAATGFAPGHTWFVKNLENGETPAVVEDLIVAILNYSGYTNVFDIEEYPQYLYCSNDRETLSALSETGKAEVPEGEEDPDGEEEGLTFTSFVDFIRKIINSIVELVRNLIGFGQSKPFSSVFSDGSFLDEGTTAAGEVDEP